MGGDISEGAVDPAKVAAVVSGGAEATEAEVKPTEAD